MKTIYKLQWCLLVMCMCSINIVKAQSLETDSLALVDLYMQCGGDGWIGFDTWLSGPIAEWEDVTVDSATQRITHVEFINMSLVGELPASLGNIDKMSGKIQLNKHAGLVGELPATLWNWTGVERFQLKFTGITSIDYTGIENMTVLNEFNTESTPLTGMVPGVLFTLPAMEKLYLHDSGYDALPPEFTSISGLTRLYLNGNDLTEIPDMSGMTWGSGAKVRVHNNSLTFEDLMPNMPLAMDANVAEFRYSPQAQVGSDSQLFPMAGSEVTLVAGVAGDGNSYLWIKGEDEVVAETDTFTIESFDPAVHTGEYYARVQNAAVPELDILSGSTGLYGSTLAIDSLALVDLYNDCGGAEWEGFDTWLNGPISTWEKVTVDSASQRVTNVEFKDMHLVGELPESLGDIERMSGKIEFRDDSLLTGTLPSFLWKWVNVERFQIKFSGYTSIDTDGLENMVNLTEFNTEGSPMVGMVPGVLFTLPSMVKLYFHEGEFDALPPELASVSGLDRLYLNGDNFTEIPDMSGIVWKDGAKVRVQNNFLTFEDLEPNTPLLEDTLVAEFRYSPQAEVGNETTLFPEAGSTVELVANVGGSENVYTWVKGEEAVGESDTLVIESFDEITDAGTYFAIVQNSIVPELDIMTATTTLRGNPIIADSLALVDLYNDCGGTEWEGFDTWLNGPLATWEKVTVDSASRRVVNVEFKDMHLVGELPATLGNLDEMSGKIEFRDDSLLTGTLPSFLWNWTKVARFQIKFSGYTDIDTDGVENMVNLTEFNTEGSPMVGEVPGVFFTLPSMVKLYFHDGEFDALPSELTSATGLDRLYLNGDNFTELPDMSGITWKDGAKVRVHNNLLTFEDLEYNMPLTMDTLVEEFRYSPQAMIGDSTTISLDTGDTLRISTAIGGTANTYLWVKDAVEVDGASEASFQIDSVTVDDSGVYYTLVQNSIVTGLDLVTANTAVNVAPPSGIEEVPFEELVILGNPVGERLIIKSKDLIGKISVFNTSGQLVFSNKYDAKEVQLNMDGNLPGTYFIILQNDVKYQTVKVIKK